MAESIPNQGRGWLSHWHVGRETLTVLREIFKVNVRVHVLAITSGRGSARLSL